MNCVSDNASKNSTRLPDMSALLVDTERCVACGLCLSSCPTYSATHKETHSPRGRILLINALASNTLPASETVSSHLEQCLHCGNCERVCPAHVPYGSIIDRAKAILLKRDILAPLPRWLQYLLEIPALHNVLGFSIKVWQQSGLQSLARRYRLLRWKKLAALEAMLPPAIAAQEAAGTHARAEAPPATAAKEAATAHTRGGKAPATAAQDAAGTHARAEAPPATAAQDAAATTSQNAVHLFTGCVGQLVERPTLTATRYLLQSCGYRVTSPSSQVCCGALYQHNGMVDRAQQCMQHNLSAFGNTPVISCASGCSAHWRCFAPDSPHDDISDFLLEHNAFVFNELDTIVALHTPCTAKAAFRRPNAPLELLKKIPKLVVKTLPDETGCCGAGGSHLLQPSNASTTLAKEKIKALLASKASILLTTNTGCAMHMRRMLYLQDIDIPVLHPTVLLYRQHRRHDDT